MNELHATDEERFERIVQWHMQSTLFGFVPLSKEDSDWIKTHSLEDIMTKGNQQEP